MSRGFVILGPCFTGWLDGREPGATPGRQLVHVAFGRVLGTASGVLARRRRAGDGRPVAQESLIDITSDELHPLTDAVGKLIERCQGMEVMLMSTAAVLTQRDYLAVERAKSSGAVKMLRGVAERLSTDSGQRLKAVLDDVDKVLQKRHAVVHGVWVGSADGSKWRSIRPTLRPKSLDDLVTAHDFDRNSLLQTARLAEQCLGTFQVWMDHWAEELGIEDD